MDPIKPRLPAMRVFSYSIAGVLGLLLTSTTMPSLFGTSSNRALINAPTQLITSPIKGVVIELALSPGGRVSEGQRVGHVRNDEVGREKLIELEIKASELKNDLSSSHAALAQAAELERHLEVLIEEQSHALTAQLRAAVDVAAARLKESEAQIAIARDQGQRDQTLLTRGVLGGTLVQSTKILEAVMSLRDAAAADLQAASGRLDVSSRGIFLGSDNGQVNSLKIELRDIQNRSIALRTEIDVLERKLADVSALQAAERARVAKLTEQDVTAGGEILVTRVGASQGAAVAAGDTLAQGVDCGRAFVVAIFPERNASTLAGGAPVTVTSADWSEPVHGYVSSLVPRTTSAEDVSFAVPFPPTERRELYAYIELSDKSVLVGSRTCLVGHWVDVSVDAGGISAQRFVEQVATLWGEATVIASWGSLREAERFTSEMYADAGTHLRAAWKQVVDVADRTAASSWYWLRSTFSTEAVATEANVTKKAARLRSAEAGG